MWFTVVINSTPQNMLQKYPLTEKSSFNKVDQIYVEGNTWIQHREDLNKHLYKNTGWEDWLHEYSQIKQVKYF